MKKCRKGHILEENLYLYQTKAGKEKRRCSICKKEYDRIYYATYFRRKPCSSLKPPSASPVGRKPGSANPINPET
jgi:hypothetical protein